MKKIIMIIGSQRQNSFNKQLAQYVEEMMNEKAEVSYLDYRQLPFIHLEDNQMEWDIVKQVRKEVLSADGIWFFSPVYNREMPGLLKNVIDWLSCPLSSSDRHGPTALTGKVVTVSTAASSGHEGMFEQFHHLLPILKTKIAGDFVKVSIQKENWISGELSFSEESTKALLRQMEQFLEELYK